MSKKIKKLRKPYLRGLLGEHASVLAVSLFVLLALGAFYFVHGFYPDLFSRTVEISSSIQEVDTVKFSAHPLTGQKCENSKARPIAVMLAEDMVTRPLSGISKADVIVEMPVVKDGITRMMAVFACEEPPDIGSVRSSRDDFIPLAAAFDAIYAHWGGSHFALDELNGGVIDNIDALINPYSVFFRKNTILAPHNGFTSYEKLSSTAEKLGYRMETDFGGYPHIDGDPASGTDPTTISIGYPYPVNVSYIYDPDENIYYRWRGGTPEYDSIDNSQASASVLIVVKTQTRYLEGQYNDVDVTGEGEALIFQNGRIQNARWQKSETPLKSKLKFLDADGKEVPFVPGKMWVHIVDTYTEILWGDNKV
ncbi:MAG: hypothetical protein A2919_00635 [Candidatus Spechtbacteria bacterium RIFCSPLOWO2_01_FULL_43_12]|uniref:DUF3048 domain-containing protein n=1 Tax=Candidatus Spechtbacteria bacterium RIFCSPLOWO2_01_FULL_43_12 TaxID=1802162 RepID=A0A1G2HEU0_9BACT|nr:MAG: hypothetical protein A2919_00635 [Candidatus Spechtbacteria bacterium RIFCSPLOWO2_01_FULL_43_12]